MCKKWVKRAWTILDAGRLKKFVGVVGRKNVHPGFEAWNYFIFQQIVFIFTS